MTDDFERRLSDRLRDLADSAPEPPFPESVGAAPTHTRRTVLLAAAALVIVVALLVVARHDSSRSTVRATSSAVPTTSSATSTTAVATSETTATTVDGSVSTSVPSTTTTEPVPDCTADDLSGRTSTDKPQYAAGETVTITVTITNRSNHACVEPSTSPCAFGSTVKITDSGDALVWRPGAHAQGLCAQPEPTVIARGDSFTWTTVQWDQHFCTGACAQDGFTNPDESGEGSPVPPGTYGAQPADEVTTPAGSTTVATFEITA